MWRTDENVKGKPRGKSKGREHHRHQGLTKNQANETRHRRREDTTLWGW